MAKPHKFAQNGLGLDTSLTREALQSICAQVAPAATGNHWQGKQKVTLASSQGGEQLYQMTAGLFKETHMTFFVRITEHDGRRQLITEIDTYLTVQDKAGFIPAGPKKMTAHHVYVEFLTLLANTVRTADPSAHISLVTGAYQQVAIPRPMSAAPMAPAATPPPTPPPPGAARATAEPADPIATYRPPPPPPAPPATTPSATHRPPPPPAAVDETTVRTPPRPQASRWWLDVDGHEPVAITARMVLGRAPQLSSASEQPVPIGGGTPTLSATHAAIEIINDQLTVTDLGSTNGTVIVTDEQDEIECIAGVPVSVPEGATIELGELVITIRHETREAP